MATSSTSDARAALKSVIGAGKTAVQKIGTGEIKNFIASQPDVSDLEITNLRGSGDVGASSGIVLFNASYTQGGEKITRDLVLRHAPNSETRLFYHYDMSRQFRVQEAMFESGVPVPQPLWLDKDGSFLGAQGYIMTLEEGEAPNPSAFAQGPIADATPEQRQSMLEQVMAAMVKIHNTDLKAAGLTDFEMDAPGQSPLEKSINWYWQTWDWIAVAEHSRLVPVYQWLIENNPGGKPELMHGDSTLHNYMFRDHRLVAVLDWEMSCLGRAEADLALQCIGNKLFAAPKESGLPQPPSEEEWLALYRKAGGRPLADFTYYKKFAAFMIVVAISALQRNMTVEQKQAQTGFLDGFWKILEA